MSESSTEDPLPLLNVKDLRTEKFSKHLIKILQDTSFTLYLNCQSFNKIELKFIFYYINEPLVFMFTVPNRKGNTLTMDNKTY